MFKQSIVDNKQQKISKENMDNNCVDCQTRIIVSDYTRCTVCYLSNKMCRLEKQLSHTKTLYWKALTARTLLKKVVVKTKHSRLTDAYKILLKRVKSGKIDSVVKEYFKVTSDYIECAYSVIKGSYKISQYACMSNAREFTGDYPTFDKIKDLACKKLLEYIDSYDYTYRPDLDYDCDHEDELGRPLYPPKRTEQETEILRKKLDLELDEYMERKEETGYSYSIPDSFSDLQIKMMRNPEFTDETDYSGLYEKTTKKTDPEPSLVGLEWD